MSKNSRHNLRDIMNKLLVLTLFVTLSLSAQGFRLPRDAEEIAPGDDEQGTLGKLNSVVKQYYETSVNKAADLLEAIKGMKLEEKAKSAYADTTTVVGTYAGIFQDQVYHFFYPH
ncbi:hypothetical protein DPEC_G00144890 [Dallia pectoralis]|uniref:Uncharacterized protein n=1 Tax=Dallia pectoralis TaxID=75939 RepID=A0ACC2GPB9_DALPE|nr:hypothetical protein DPEC_G00144890 [Dallia pectoralis]